MSCRSSNAFCIVLASVMFAGIFCLELAVGQEPTNAPTPVAEPQIAKGELQGNAYLGRNRWVMGATVLLSPENDPSQLFMTSTGARGEFRFQGLRDGSYRIEVSRDGLAHVLKTGVTLKTPFRAVVEVPMQPLGSAPANTVALGGSAAASRVAVTGSILEQGFSPLADIELHLVQPRGHDDPRRVHSAADGSFAVADLAAGRWVLEVKGVGFLTIRTTLDLASDARLRVSLVRQPPGYVPSPLELMPREQPIPPADYSDRPGRSVGAPAERTAK